MSNQYIVTGGNPLKGSVTVGGSKNTVTKMMVASLLTKEPVKLSSIPHIGEVELTMSLLNSLGAQAMWDGTKESSVHLVSPTLQTSTVPAVFSGKHRIPILLAGPLLHRFGHAEIPIEGGDKIGPRPVDFHITGYRAMGAEIVENGNTIVFKANKLHGAVIELPYPSVMTTESLLLGAVLAEGKTVIKNAAIEPEIIELVDLLQKMGAIIFLEPERTFVVEGVAKLNGAEHRVAPDRIEAASFACAAIATKGSVLVKGVSQHGMRTFLNMLRKIGGAFEISNDGIWFYSTGQMKGVTMETGTHPGFMTDWQPPFSLLLMQAEGMSVVHETVHEKRFGYFDGLKKMGADVNLFTDCLGGHNCRFQGMNYQHSVAVRGPVNLKAVDLVVPDLRAGFVYVIAALMAQGTSVISGVDQLERGYESLVEKLRGLGADIQVVDEASDHLRGGANLLHLVGGAGSQVSIEYSEKEQIPLPPEPIEFVI